MDTPSTPTPTSLPPLTPTPSSPPASFESIIVPPEPPPPPPQAPTEKPVAPTPSGGSGGTIGKKSHIGPIIAVLVLLLVTLPLSVLFITNRNESSDVRSRAAGECKDEAYPAWSTCSAKGVTGVDSQCNCLECRERNSWTDKTLVWVPCGATDTCPWTPVNGQCCPNETDRCNYNKPDKICIGDPYTSHCEKWGDGTCPGGGGVWLADHWYVDCTTEGCGGNPDLTCVKLADGSQNLCRNQSCPQDTDCICSGTPPPTTSSPTPTPGGQCDDIKIYKGEAVVTDLSTLAAGDVISIYVRGANATKGRVRINGGAFSETTLERTVGTVTWFVAPDITIPTGVTSITIESEVYVDGVWK